MQGISFKCIVVAGRAKEIRVWGKAGRAKEKKRELLPEYQRAGLILPTLGAQLLETWPQLPAEVTRSPPPPPQALLKSTTAAQRCPVVPLPPANAAAKVLRGLLCSTCLAGYAAGAEL